MAAIHREIGIAVDPARLWAAARDIGALHTQLVPGFVVDTTVDGEIRTVHFANGLVVRERVVTIDEPRRRIAWSVLDSPQLRYHHASLQLFADDDGCRAVWIADVLPDAAAPQVAAMIEQGLAAMQRAQAPQPDAMPGDRR